MSCPICEQRKAKRFCPAKAESICSICCGTEREVTIDCPSDCAHLITSRPYDQERREIDWSKIPFADTKIPSSFVVAHQQLAAALSLVVCTCAQGNRLLVDSDARAALEALAESYRTLASGLYYENPPAHRFQRELYDALKTAVEDLKKASAREVAATAPRGEEIRDVVIFLAQLGATRANGRPKGRAFLDFLRAQFKPEVLSKPATNLILRP